MTWLDSIAKRFFPGLLEKSGVTDSASLSSGTRERNIDEKRITRIESVEAQIRMNRNYFTVDGIKAFLELPEVFFPIDFIASRVAGAHFEIRKTSDDSIVWCANRSKEAKGVSALIAKPNWRQYWREFVYTHFVQKLATGNGFIRAAMNSDVFTADTPKWEWCTNLWTIPSSQVTIDSMKTNRLVSIFGCEDESDVINGYVIGGTMRVPTWQIYHDRDLYSDMGDGKTDFLWSPSRLFANEKNITILRRVYDARNTIYDKCGALGILTNRSTDETGHVAMIPEEKQEIIDHYNGKYGTGEKKSPTLVTDANVDYLKTGADISQLMPFDETLEDAIKIAGIYNIPAVLVPRKDQSTFSNQATAEKAVYDSVIIPMCEKFCNELTLFLGLKDYYIWCNFDDVDCLQAGRKEEEQVKTLVNSRCRQQFNDGLITINDWRAQIHESAFEGEIFNKTKFEMTPEELDKVNSIISPTTNLQTAIKDEDENKKPSDSDKDE